MCRLASFTGLPSLFLSVLQKMATAPNTATREITNTNSREASSQASDLLGRAVQRVRAGQDEVCRKGQKGAFWGQLLSDGGIRGVGS